MGSEVALSRRPEVLFEASLERREEAAGLFEQGRLVLSMYVSGVAVEAILQALALSGGARHDAHHDLDLWLAKSSAEVADAIKDHAATEWSLILGLWSNDLRYLSFEGLLGRLRMTRMNRGIKLGKDGPRAIVWENARRCVQAALTVHAKGLELWRRRRP